TDTESPVETPVPSPSATGSDHAVDAEIARKHTPQEIVPTDAQSPETTAREDNVSVETVPRSSGGASGPSPEQVDECIRSLTEIFQQAKVVPHWPMYLRNVKQYIKNAAPAFDERKFGFTN